MMMMIRINGGDNTPHSNPTVQVPPWDDYHFDPNTPFPLTPNGNAEISSFEALTALHRYLPSNTATNDVVLENDDLDIPVDAFSCDDFRMYEFKVRKCTRGRSHDWTECPFAHPGEKARRRDPRKYHYSGNSCPEFRKGQCLKGDACEYAHGVFECWLHPARYRTQPCKDGTHCKRRVCFFAHTPDQLRVLPVTESVDEFPSRIGHDSFFTRSGFRSPPSSPPSEWTESPPLSPSWNSVSGLAESMRVLQIGKAPRTGMGVGMGMSMSPPAWGSKMGFGSPRSPIAARPGFNSLPTTPTRNPARSGLGVFDLWEQGGCGEEPVMERVESGRDLRAKIYAKLSKENSLDSANPGPDVGWISELIN